MTLVPGFYNMDCMDGIKVTVTGDPYPGEID